MIKRPGYAIRHVQGLAIVMLLLVSLLILALFASNGEARRGVMATGHTLPLPLYGDASGQPGSRPLWQAAEDSIYNRVLPLVILPRCRLMRAGQWPWRQHTSFVPDCWLDSFDGGT